MKVEELICKQQLELEELKTKVSSFEDAFKRIRANLYSIGAPLNDNFLEYRKDQLAVFFRIAAIMETCDD